MSLRARVTLFLLCLLVAGVCLRLAWWQHGRLVQRRVANAAAMASERRMTVSGIYDQKHELVLRGRAYREVPGVEVVTPLRVAGSDTAVLVNRGFIPSPDAATVDLDALVEPGTVTVSGIALPIRETGDSGRPVPIGGRVTWARLDRGGIRGWLPYPVAEIVLWQSPDSTLPPLPRRLEPPALNDGPHLLYAIQWIAFAAIFLGGGVIVLRRPVSQPTVEIDREDTTE